MQNISSEQELKQLLDEGRITEKEYRELLEVIRQKATFKQVVPNVRRSTFQMDNLRKGLLVGFMIAFFMIVMALLIKIIFKIGMLESMTISGLAAGPILLIIKGFLLLRQKNR